ncbi:hypothetical protein TIFTF001_022506 [Ficus carica]|uniref:Uncharacterized protein n=1 Tax=Ficus carica TaxID=3494 RepID=A0AA88DK03_FICCA|nr:hypothetical protein TIFTF001_022506 [Ficus carica]
MAREVAVDMARAAAVDMERAAAVAMERAVAVDMGRVEEEDMGRVVEEDMVAMEEGQEKAGAMAEAVDLVVEVVALDTLKYFHVVCIWSLYTYGACMLK